MGTSEAIINMAKENNGIITSAMVSSGGFSARQLKIFG